MSVAHAHIECDSPLQSKAVLEWRSAGIASIAVSNRVLGKLLPSYAAESYAAVTEPGSSRDGLGQFVGYSVAHATGTQSEGPLTSTVPM